MTRLTTLLFISMALVLSHCAPAKPPQTQMQIRQFQTRMYNITDSTRALKAVMNVLQDEGYIVKQANTELGLLVATKEAPISGAGFSRFMMGPEATYDTTQVTECSANVTPYNGQMRVRVNFIQKRVNNRGGVSQTVQVGDETFYQNFFSKVSKGIFIENQNL